MRKAFHAVFAIALVGAVAGCRADLQTSLNISEETAQVAVVFSDVAYEELRSDSALVNKISEAVTLATGRTVDVVDNGQQLAIRSKAVEWSQLNELSGVTGVVVGRQDDKVSVTFVQPEEFIELLSDAVEDEVAHQVYLQTVHVSVIVEGDVALRDVDASAAPSVTRQITADTIRFSVPLSELDTSQQVVVTRNPESKAVWVGVGLVVVFAGWVVIQRLRTQKN